jgi:hypothetical protein
MPAENAPTRRIGAYKPRLSLLTGAGNNKAMPQSHLLRCSTRPQNWASCLPFDLKGIAAGSASARDWK